MLEFVTIYRYIFSTIAKPQDHLLLVNFDIEIVLLEATKQNTNSVI